MLIIFTGPEGAPFLGREIDAVTVQEASLEDLAALQRGTKLTMKQIMERLQSVQDATPDDVADAEVADPYNDLADSSTSANEMFNMQVMVFLALRTAGFRIHWRVARDMKFGDFDTVADEVETDDADEVPAPVEAGDPQVAARGSQEASVAVEQPILTAATPISQP